MLGVKRENAIVEIHERCFYARLASERDSVRPHNDAHGGVSRAIGVTLKYVPVP